MPEVLPDKGRPGKCDSNFAGVNQKTLQKIMKRKTMSVALALLFAAGGCRSGLEATEALKVTEASAETSERTDSATTTVSEKILTSIHRFEDECAAAIVRFVDGGGEIRVDSGGSTTARGVASIEGRRDVVKGSVKEGAGEYEKSESSTSREESSAGEQSETSEASLEKRTESSQGSMWLSIFFLCLGYFLTGAAIRITKNVKS